MDIMDELRSQWRAVGPGTLALGKAHTVALRRAYQADIEDVWDAITNPERIARWFLPVTGDLRVGGHYQIERNAGGEILRCEPPRLLLVTSLYGDAEPGSSEVEVRLDQITPEQTTLVLEHTMIPDPAFWKTYGPGAVGVGWDLTVYGLGCHFAGMSTEDKEAWGRSDEARQFMAGSSDLWRIAHEESGVPADQAVAAADATLRFYLPE